MTESSNLVVDYNASIDKATRYLDRNAMGPQWFFFQRPPSQYPPLDIVRTTEERLEMFVTALERKTVATPYVSLDTGFTGQIGHSATVDRFFDAIGNLPQLDMLSWFTSDRMFGRSLQTLTRILTLARGLNQLECRGVGFAGTTEDFVAFAAALGGHPALCYIRFFGCSVAPENQTAACIDPVIKALASVPKLNSIIPSCWAPPIAAMDEDNHGFDTTIAALADLCHHPSLTCMTFFDYLLGSKSRLEPIMVQIQASTNLRNLALNIALQERECELVANIIRYNKSLAFLGLNIGNLGPDNNDQHLLQIIQALESSSTATGLNLNCGFGRDKYVPSHRTGQALATMLETNMSLTHVDFFPAPGEWDFLAKTNFFVSLNRYGRKEVIRNPKPTQNNWVQVLAMASQDVSCLFYFLSRNPALCDVALRQGRRKPNAHPRPCATNPRPRKSPRFPNANPRPSATNPRPRKSPRFP